MDSEYIIQLFSNFVCPVQFSLLSSQLVIFPHYTHDSQSCVTLNHCIHSRLWALPMPRKAMYEIDFIFI